MGHRQTRIVWRVEAIFLGVVASVVGVVWVEKLSTMEADKNNDFGFYLMTVFNFSTKILG